jgi:transcriptional regulator with XRE-family HTH domain
MVKDIIKQFKYFCEVKGWKQKEIAERLECDRSHISKIFSGTRNPSITILEKMEEVMNNER